MMEKIIQGTKQVESIITGMKQPQSSIWFIGRDGLMWVKVEYNWFSGSFC